MKIVNWIRLLTKILKNFVTKWQWGRITWRVERNESQTLLLLSLCYYLRSFLSSRQHSVQKYYTQYRWNYPLKGTEVTTITLEYVPSSSMAVSYKPGSLVRDHSGRTTVSLATSLFRLGFKCRDISSILHEPISAFNSLQCIKQCSCRTIKIHCN